MIELGVVVLFLIAAVAPVVLWQANHAFAEGRVAVVQRLQTSGGPYRGAAVEIESSVRLPERARGAIVFCFAYGAAGLLATFPVLLGLLRGWASVAVVGVPWLLLAWALLLVGVGVLRKGPAVAPWVAAAGLAQAALGAAVVLVVMTITDAQHGPVAGLEQAVAYVLQLPGERLRDASWVLPFSIDHMGAVPLFLATSSMVHGALLLSAARSLFAARALSAGQGGEP